MFLGQGSYEITGGRPDLPPLVSDVVPKPLVSEGLTLSMPGFHKLGQAGGGRNLKFQFLWLTSDVIMM